MQTKTRPHLADNIITLAVLLLFLLYCIVITLKTSVVFGVNEIALSYVGAKFPCDAGCTKVVNAFIDKEVFDHLRTGSVSMLVGLVVGLSLLGAANAPPRRVVIAIVLCGLVVLASAPLGEAQMDTRVLLSSIGALGLFRAWRYFHGQPAVH